jgi:fermentation-respiration switch protein FrsA (DUF1100 family)
VKNEWVEVRIGKALMEDARHFTMEKLIKIYKTPTLILHGISDQTVPFKDSLKFSQKSPANPLELVLISGGDHRLTLAKDALFHYMCGFCKRIGIF